MDGANKKAWKILNEDEQLALSLKHGHGKSTWEAGEIMGKAHYKFLEIEARARTFLKMFSEHILMYDEIIPDYIPLDDNVRRYFKYTIEKRKKVKDAVEKINDNVFSIRSVRDKAIIDSLEKLNNSKSAINKNFVIMIMEFDRWNNFRILPKEVQEPSAYKRRNKNNDKKNINNLLSMNTYTVDKLIERYENTSNHPDTKLVYVPMFSKLLNNGGKIVNVKNSDEAIKELSKVGFYIFTQEKRAQQFFDLLYNYDFDQPKNCKDGQNFWPKYRVLIRYSLNYNNIQKRIASRKFLETALRDLDLTLLNPKNKDSNKPKRKRRKNKKLGLD